MIQLESIRKSYGNHLVIEIPELILERSIYWLKGVNGSGKTTLMKLIAGLLPFEGDVVIDKTVSLKKNRTGYLHCVNYAEAEPLFPPFLTGNDLMQLFVKTKKANPKQADELANALQVKSFIHNPIGTYSSGMVKKISLIMAFIGHPKLILLDEPLVTIDDLTVPEINTLIRDYHEQQGVTFLLTSHQSFEASGFPVAQELLVNEQTVTFQ